MRSHVTRRAAFTLVELLTVIAILTLLLTLLLPLLQSARGVARRGVCATNQKGHGLAVSTFVADMRGYLPCASMSRPSGGYPYYDDPPFWEFYDSATAAANSESMVNGEAWVENYTVNRFYPYYRNISLSRGWICPAHPHADQAGKAPYIFGQPDPSPYRTYYLMNARVCTPFKPCGPYMTRQKRKIEQITQPSVLFEFVDRRDYANDLDPDRSGSSFSIYTNVTSSNTGHGPDDIGVHHQGGFNACFVDGHVAHINMAMDPANPAQFITGMAHPPLRRENFDLVP